MGLLGRIFGFLTPTGQFSNKLQKIRKRWDRIREKVDRKDYSSKVAILERLDRVEQDIRTLEEKDDKELNIWAKRKILGEVEIEIDRIKEMIKEEEIGQKSEIGAIEKKISNYGK
jgi:hypothetical protein